MERASGTSKKTELKLTGVARSSLEELRMDYRDFLRQRGLGEWAPEHPALVRFKRRRCASLEQVQDWVRDERRRAKDTDARTDTDSHGRTRTKTGATGSVPVRVRPDGARRSWLPTRRCRC